MSKARSFFKYWLPVLIWMAVIFTASADTESYQHSSRLIAPILHWLFPRLSDKSVDLGVFIARKCAHLTEYGIFGMLLWRALRKPRKADPRPWSWREARNAVLLVAFYAATDEFHQLFVATRDATVHDVFVDTTGGALGIAIVWAIWRWQHARATEGGAKPSALEGGASV